MICLLSEGCPDFFGAYPLSSGFVQEPVRRELLGSSWKQLVQQLSGLVAVQLSGLVVVQLSGLVDVQLSGLVDVLASAA